MGLAVLCQRRRDRAECELLTPVPRFELPSARGVTRNGGVAICFWNCNEAPIIGAGAFVLLVFLGCCLWILAQNSRPAMAISPLRICRALAARIQPSQDKVVRASSMHTRNIHPEKQHSLRCSEHMKYMGKDPGNHAST